MSPEHSKTTMPELPRTGDVVDERYELGEVFATGGMGVVMEASQLSTGRTVAVKLLHPHIAARDDFAERFKREVRVATLFDHPNVVRVYDVGETDNGALYLVMELLEGEELKDLIDGDAPLPLGRTVDIILQMLDGLGEAHAQEVVHRDLKPANIFISETRRGGDMVKLLDFGVAKLVNSGKSDLTATGVYAGTPAYMPPEALVDAERATETTGDIYAVGLVMMEMLTGRRVFDGDGLAQTLIQHLKNPVKIPEPVQETPLAEVIRKATMKHPSDRFGDADEMFAALDAVRDDIPADLRLEAHQIPDPYDEASPSLLEQLAQQTTDEGLEMLRGAPQHETFVPSAKEEQEETVEFQARPVKSDASPVPDFPSTPAPSVDTGVDTVERDRPDSDEIDHEAETAKQQVVEEEPDEFEGEPTQVMTDANPSGEFEVEATQLMEERPHFDEEPTIDIAESEPEPPPVADTGHKPPPDELPDDSDEFEVAPTTVSPPPIAEQPGDFETDPDAGPEEPTAQYISDQTSQRVTSERVDTTPEAPVAEVREWMMGRARRIRTGARPYLRRLKENPKLFAFVSISFAALVATLVVISSGEDGDDEPGTVNEQIDRQVDDALAADGDPEDEAGADGSDEGKTDDEPMEVSLDDEPPLARFIFDTEPDGAEVVADGESLGTTRLDIEFEQEEFPEVITFRKDGYLEESWEPTDEQRREAFDSERDGIAVELKLEEEPAPEPTPRRRRSPPSDPDPPEDSEEDDSDVDSVFERHFGD